MPTGKVRFFDEEKGYGFIDSDEGNQVFLHISALPAGTTSVRKGARVEFSVADGKKGAQALSVRVLDAPPSLVKLNRKPADEMAVIVEDLIRVLDDISGPLKRGHHPEPVKGKKVAALLRKLAEELDA
ncbi:MAG: cold-shock protein [Micrococcales bacterium]